MLRSAALVVVMAAVAQGPLVRDFDGDAAGRPPPGLVLAVGRDAAPGRWTVRLDGGGHVLQHLGAAGPAGGFAVAVLDGAQYDDAQVSVRLKASAGSRTAGMVWKYRDPLNHYALQLNLGEQTLEIYRVVRGNHIRVERDDDLELDPDAWHSLRIRQHGDEVRVYLGGIRVFRDRDRALRGGGTVGLWAAGDTTVAFDDFRVEPEGHRRR